MTIIDKLEVLRKIVNEQTQYNCDTLINEIENEINSMNKPVQEKQSFISKLFKHHK